MAVFWHNELSEFCPHIWTVPNTEVRKFSHPLTAKVGSLGPAPSTLGWPRTQFSQSGSSSASRDTGGLILPWGSKGIWGTRASAGWSQGATLLWGVIWAVVLGGLSRFQPVSCIWVLSILGRMGLATLSYTHYIFINGLFYFVWPGLFLMCVIKNPE